MLKNTYIMLGHRFMRWVVILAIPAALIIIPPPSIFHVSAQSRCPVTISVYDSDGRPIAGKTVVASTGGSCITNSNGVCTINVSGPGQVTFTGTYCGATTITMTPAMCASGYGTTLACNNAPGTSGFQCNTSNGLCEPCSGAGSCANNCSEAGDTCIWYQCGESGGLCEPCPSYTDCARDCTELGDTCNWPITGFQCSASSGLCEPCTNPGNCANDCPEAGDTCTVPIETGYECQGTACIACSDPETCLNTCSGPADTVCIAGLVRYQCVGGTCEACADPTLCLNDCASAGATCAVIPPGTQEIPPCLCPNGTCCPLDTKIIPPISKKPSCTVVNPTCSTPPTSGCQFPIRNPDGTPFEQCKWRVETNDCNPYQWSPSLGYKPYVEVTGDECTQPSRPDQTCTYQVAAQNYVKTDQEACNNVVVRDVCSRSSAPYSTASCNGTSQVGYIRKLNQCCDPTRNVTLGGVAVCSKTDSPDSRCSECNGTDGALCVDGETDVCRKAIRVETFETRTRSNTVPAGATCAACVERRTVGQETGCGGAPDCATKSSCSLNANDDGAGGFSCDDGSSPFDCDGTQCCGTCTASPPTCTEYSCPAPGQFLYAGGACSNSEVSPECTVDGVENGCLNVSECCKIQNEVRVGEIPKTCSNPPGNCTVEGVNVCPGGCLTGWNPGDPPTPICSAPVSTSCGTCCGDEEFCTQKADVSEDKYFPPEATNCSLYEYTTRANLYTVEYESNKITLTYEVTNLSNHRLYDVRGTIEIPDFMDIRNVSNNYGSYSVFCEGGRVDSDPFFPEYADRKCHGGSINFHFTNNNPALIAYYRNNPPECYDPTAPGDQNRCGDPNPETGIWEPFQIFTFPGDSLPGPDGIIGSSDDDRTSLANQYKATIKIELVPSVIGPRGAEDDSHYEDHVIPLDEITYYQNQLVSDNRLSNLELTVNWASSDPQTGAEVGVDPTSRVVELDSFWIGKGVKSTGLTCSGSGCFIDPDSRPFGWPTFGRISEDWGGADDIATAEGISWSNPRASDIAWDSSTNEPRITLAPPLYDQNGEYIAYCGDNDGSLGWRHTGISIVPYEGVASAPNVYSTQSGYVTHIGYNSKYPGRGWYIEVASSIDDDCQYNFVSRYGNLMPNSTDKRVQVGEYIPRHKLLGIMGDTGDTASLLAYTGAGGLPLSTHHTGITRTLYQIRYGGTYAEDIADNNVFGGTDDTPPHVDPYSIKNPLFDPNYVEPDDIGKYASSLGGDTCNDNPYICEYSSWEYYGPCDLASHNAVFFCQNRRSPETVSRCYYANP